MEKAHQVQAFQRWIHGIYHRNSAVAHFFSRRIRPAGMLLIMMIPAVWVIMPLHALGPIFQLRGLVFVLLCIAFLWVVLRRAKLHASRELPRLATATEPVSYRLHLRNDGKTSINGASLLEIAPDNRPSLEKFSFSKEPGEETRNAFDQKFGYYRWEWLQRTLTYFTQKQPVQLPHLKPGEEATVNITIIPKKRGVMILKDLRVCLPDPLGIFQRCRPTNNPPGKLIVLPKRYRLPSLNLPGSARFQLGGEAASNTIGQSGDFTSVRDYRPGDPLRHIHWKSWAKTGKPIVKEYEDVFFPRYGLVLDTFVPEQDADMFEEAVSVAASFAANIDTRDTLLDLMFIRDEAFVFSAGRGEERVDRMLEILAGVSTEPTPDFEALQRLVFRYQDELTACICIFTGWCSQRQETVRKLHSAGINLSVISICRDLDSAKIKLQEHPCPTPVQLLRTTHIQEDLLTHH